MLPITEEKVSDDMELNVGVSELENKRISTIQYLEN